MNQRNSILSLFALIILTSGLTFYFFDKTKSDWLMSFWGVIGTNLSVLGIIYTAAQIKMLRTESEIIKATTIETREKIGNLNQFADIATGIKLIQEIQGYTRLRKHEFGILRLQELKIIIGKINWQDSILRRPFDKDATVLKLNQLINSMEKDIAARTNSLQPPLANSSLEKILDLLAEIQSDTLQRT